MTFEQRYVQARRRFIEADFANLNDMQRKAVLATEGPLLLLAGAGSGKSTVLIQRVYNLLTYGRGSDSDEVPVWATEEDLQVLESFPARPTEEDVRRARHLLRQHSGHRPQRRRDGRPHLYGRYVQRRRGRSQGIRPPAGSAHVLPAQRGPAPQRGLCHGR